MTWTETHRRWQALAEIEALANATDSHDLPWNADYADIFGDRDHLIAALRHRWNQTRHTQLDVHLPEHVYEQQRRRLTARHAGVLRVLRNWDAEQQDLGRGLPEAVPA
jgi:hypothetical protein